MPQPEYSAANITVLEFPDSVRRRPGMYFGIGPANPALPTRILERRIGGALHPAPRAAAVHTPIVRVEILGDLAFTVTDDQAAFTDRPSRTILPFDYVWLAPVAFSKHAIIEAWQDDLGLHQHFDDGRPVGPPREFTPPTPHGTRMTFRLDPAMLAPGAAITTKLATLDLHGPDCTDPTPCDLVIHDLR